MGLWLSVWVAAGGCAFQTRTAREGDGSPCPPSLLHPPAPRAREWGTLRQAGSGPQDSHHLLKRMGPPSTSKGWLRPHPAPQPEVQPHLPPVQQGGPPPPSGPALPQLCLPLDAFLGGLALELPGLPLLKFGGPFPGSDGPPNHPGGRPDLGLGRLQVHGQAGRDPAATFGFWTPPRCGPSCFRPASQVSTHQSRGNPET